MAEHTFINNVKVGEPETEGGREFHSMIWLREELEQITSHCTRAVWQELEEVDYCEVYCSSD